MQGQIIDILHLSVQDIFFIKFDDSKFKKKQHRIIRDKLS